MQSMGVSVSKLLQQPSKRPIQMRHKTSYTANSRNNVYELLTWSNMKLTAAKNLHPVVVVCTVSKGQRTVENCTRLWLPVQLSSIFCCTLNHPITVDNQRRPSTSSLFSVADSHRLLLTVCNCRRFNAQQKLDSVKVLVEFSAMHWA